MPSHSRSENRIVWTIVFVSSLDDLLPEDLGNSDGTILVPFASDMHDSRVSAELQITPLQGAEFGDTEAENVQGPEDEFIPACSRIDDGEDVFSGEDTLREVVPLFGYSDKSADISIQIAALVSEFQKGPETGHASSNRGIRIPLF